MTRERAGTEIRVGLVMYGGVSLAIYMNGVAREFYDMVRGRGVWGAWKILADVDLVVDVVSGASAGGINGLFLAKALASRREFAPLAELWRARAGIDDLLRDAGESEPRSLLDSDYMRAELARAFQQIDNSRRAQDTDDLCPSRVEEIDCFVATTHYYGFDKTLRDGRGKPVEVRSHRAMMRFRHREGRREPFGPSDSGTGQGLSNDDLATVARATSAFPFAFRPEELDLQKFAPYFVDADENLSGKAWFVDGGILDNKPFGATLSAIYERHADRPVDRLLFYIEPDPERFDKNAESPEPRFDQVAVGALTWLPSYESILGDLGSIDAHNRRLERIADIFGETMKPWTVARNPPPVPGQQFELYWRARADDVLTSLCEPMRDKLLDDLIKSLGQFEPGQGEKQPASQPHRTRAIQNLMLMLRDEDSPLPSRPLTRPLEGVDLAFLKRAVFYWIYALHRGLGPKQDSGLVSEWSECWKASRPTQSKTELIEAVRRLNQIADGILVLEAGVARSLRSADAEATSLGGFVRAWLKGAGDVDAHVASLTEGRKRWDDPRSLADKFKESIDTVKAQPDASLERALALAKALGDALNTVVQSVLPEVRALETFFTIDVWQFPALHLAEVAEMDRIEYFRISPIDSDAPTPWLPRGHRWESNKMRKVAGRSLAHFSAFLKRSWRSNDILWGRLDAATIAWEAFVKTRGHGPDASQLKKLKRALEGMESLSAEEIDLTNLVNTLIENPPISNDEVAMQLLICHQRNIVAEELPRVMCDAMEEELRRRARQSDSGKEKRLSASSAVDSVAVSVLAQFDDACSDPFLKQLAIRAVREIKTGKAFELQALFAEDYDVGGETVRDLPSPWLEATALQAARVFTNMIKGLAPAENNLGAWAQKQVFGRASAILTALHWVMLSRQAGWFGPLWLLATVTSLGLVVSTFFRDQPWSSRIDYGAAAFLVALLFVPRQWFKGDRRVGWASRALRVALTLAIPVVIVLFWPMIPADVSIKYLLFSLALNLVLASVVWLLTRWVQAARQRPQEPIQKTITGNDRGPDESAAAGKASVPSSKTARAAGAGRRH